MSEKNPYKYNGDTLILENITDNNTNKSVYIESYGCAMNFSDSEIVASILSNILISVFIFKIIFFLAIYFGVNFKDEYYQDNIFRYFDATTFIACLFLIISSI